VSVRENAGITCQVRNKETSANEPLTKYRNTLRWRQNRGLPVLPG